MTYIITQTCQTCNKLQQLTQENLTLKTEITRLTRILIQYENPHTPPSKRLYKIAKPATPQKNPKRYPGRPQGHQGQTRQKQKTPTQIITPPKQHTNCTHCQTPLTQTNVTHHLIEEIPHRQHRQILDYLHLHHQCPNCHHTETSVHPDCPPTGIFGKNAQTQTVLMKFDLRLPFDKVAEQMEQQHGLPMSAATAFEITNRVSEDLTAEYQNIVSQVRAASKVNIDESGMKVDGVNHWIWTFVADNCTLFAIRKSRGKQVLEEILGEKFGGYIGCDGLGAYRCFSSKLQRCWAHLFREAKALAEKCVAAEGLYLALGELFFDVERCLLGVPVWMRLGIWEEAVKRLDTVLLLYDGCGTVDIEKFVGKVRNGFDYWFTFVLVEGLEPTNNRAENALREAVVQRKIFGTLRNEKGSKIYETLMTLTTTWKQQKLDLHTTMAQKLTETWTKQRS